MTKNRASLIAVLALSALSLNVSAFEIIPGKVTKISDGDTINVMPSTTAADAMKALKIRMVTMDTAELHLSTPDGRMVSQGFWGQKGADALAEILSLGDSVEIESHGKDVYGRTLGRVLKNGVDVNLAMVASGWASLYIICDGTAACDAEAAYRDACRTAVSNGLGLFDPANPLTEMPFVFRAINQKKGLSRFVGDMRNQTYVSPEKYDLVPVCERVFFSTEAVAAAEGFAPAN